MDGPKRVHMSIVPVAGACSCSLVEWSIKVPESTVMNPHISEAMLVASWPDQSCKRYTQNICHAILGLLGKEPLCSISKKEN